MRTESRYWVDWNDLSGELKRAGHSFHPLSFRTPSTDVWPDKERSIRIRLKCGLAPGSNATVFSYPKSDDAASVEVLRLKDPPGIVEKLSMEATGATARSEDEAVFRDGPQAWLMEQLRQEKTVYWWKCWLHARRCLEDHPWAYPAENFIWRIPGLHEFIDCANGVPHACAAAMNPSVADDIHLIEMACHVANVAYSEFYFASTHYHVVYLVTHEREVVISCPNQQRRDDLRRALSRDSRFIEGR